MIGSRIRIRRQELGKSQTDLAKEVGISKQTLYKYETGLVTNIPSDKVESLAQKLETTPSYLMGWEISTESKYAMEWRRFELLTDDIKEIKEFESLCEAKGLTRADLARILFSLRVRPGFQKSDFGI